MSNNYIENYIMKVLLDRESPFNLINSLENGNIKCFQDGKPFDMLSRIQEDCTHEFEEIDRIGCMYHVGLGCEDVMEQCKICNKTKTRHSMENAKMTLGEWAD